MKRERKCVLTAVHRMKSVMLMTVSGGNGGGGLWNAVLGVKVQMELRSLSVSKIESMLLFCFFKLD